MGRPVVPFALLVGALVAGCGLVTPSAGPPTSPAFNAQITTPDGPVGLVRTADSIELYLQSSDGGTRKVTSTPRGSAPTVHLYSEGGDTGRQVNTFVFGEAPGGATAVIVNGTRTAVTDGLYVVGLGVRELLPDAVIWSFRDAGDQVITQGSGIKN
jgi:hypothetical protein